MDTKKFLFIFKLKALLFKRRPTLEAGLKETWNLFKRVAGDIPVPGLGAAVEGISFFEEMHDVRQYWPSPSVSPHLLL